MAIFESLSSLSSPSVQMKSLGLVGGTSGAVMNQGINDISCRGRRRGWCGRRNNTNVDIDIDIDIDIDA